MRPMSKLTHIDENGAAREIWTSPASPPDHLTHNPGGREGERDGGVGFYVAMQNTCKAIRAAQHIDLNLSTRITP